MEDHKIYILDSNVFMEAHNRYYAFDIAPGFWDALIGHAETGRIISIDRVKKELDKGEDDLTTWANNSFHRWFAKTDDPAVIDAYRRIMEWASNQGQYISSAKADLARDDNADAWLVAYALSKEGVVVTHEKPHPDIRTRIPIPNICRAFNVECTDIFQVLRALGVKLS